MQKRLIIIDGSSLIYRAFHAIPQTLTNPSGLVTNAVFGFTQSLRKILKDFSPDYIGVAFDVKGPTFRHEKFAEYKAQRPPMPEALSPQIPYIKKVVKAYNIPVLESQSFEADDIIATIAKKADTAGIKTLIVTGDKDMYQLVGNNTVILDYNTGKEYGPDEVKEKFGVRPSQIRDFLALTGDASDGIPGVPGIGPKTAAKLLAEYDNLEAIYADITKASTEKLRANLNASKGQAFLSKELATLHPEVPFDWSLEELCAVKQDYSALSALFKELGFSKLLKELIDESAPVSAEPAGEIDILVVDTEDKALSALAVLSQCARVSVKVIMNDNSGSVAASAVAIALGEKKAFCATLEKKSAGLSFFLKVLQDVVIVKDTDNAKILFSCALKHGCEARGVGIDIGIASYLLNPSKPNHSLEALSLEHLGETGARHEKGLFEGIDAGSLDVRQICVDACNIGKIARILENELNNSEMAKLYSDMELPLAEVLAEMEHIGIRVNALALRDLSKEMDMSLAQTETAIYNSAGVKFNISSTKQLSEVLFERLKLKPVKKTKTGFSTDEEVLSQLAASHELPSLILGFRQVSKLKATYVDALSGLISPETGRVHTSFNQTVTATGRLSSSRPNMQNIPARGYYARRIREAFIADDGFEFLSADYSQIELRIMAHLSEDPVLIDAFTIDEDIHARTAREVFGVPAGAEVTAETRHRAKAINFGIIYGMGPYGLAAELGITQKEAADYIDSYFAHYTGVRRFIDSAVAGAAKRGYTTTLLGRRRFIPELNSQTESIVRLGQRLAVNTPVQGTAADIIKVAMIKIRARFKELKAKSRLLLQIHDELLFEMAKDEKSLLEPLVKAEMEGAIQLRVPVKVNTKSGANWSMVE